MNIALGLVWSLGALVQSEMTRQGIAYDHGYVFSAIMGFAAAIFFLMATYAFHTE